MEDLDKTILDDEQTNKRISHQQLHVKLIMTKKQELLITIPSAISSSLKKLDAV